MSNPHLPPHFQSIKLDEARADAYHCEVQMKVARVERDTYKKMLDDMTAQRDRLAEALRKLHSAMLRYEADVDGEAPSEHHRMMDEVREALAAVKQPENTKDIGTK